MNNSFELYFVPYSNIEWNFIKLYEMNEMKRFEIEWMEERKQHKIFKMEGGEKFHELFSCIEFNFHLTPVSYLEGVYSEMYILR